LVIDEKCELGHVYDKYKMTLNIHYTWKTENIIKVTPLDNIIKL